MRRELLLIIAAGVILAICSATFLFWHAGFFHKGEGVAKGGYYLIDVLGRNITLEKPPERVASLAPSITEILWYLGALNKTVAVDSSSDFPPIIVKWRKEGRVVDVGGYWWSTLNLEKLVETKPDLVIADEGAHLKLLGKFEELGLKVLFVHGGSAKSLEDVFIDIYLVGEALGVKKKAVELVTKLREKLETIEAKLKGVKAKRVLVVIGWSPQGIWVPGGGTFIADMVSKAGGALVTQNLAGWQLIGLEKVAEYKPQVVIVTGMSVSSKDDVLKTLRELASKHPFREMVESGVKICGLYNDAVNKVIRPGPRAVEGVAILASIIHPEVFGEVKEGVVCLS